MQLRTHNVVEGDNGAIRVGQRGAIASSLDRNAPFNTCFVIFLTRMLYAIFLCKPTDARYQYIYMNMKAQATNEPLILCDCYTS